MSKSDGKFWIQDSSSDSDGSSSDSDSSSSSEEEHVRKWADVSDSDSDSDSDDERIVRSKKDRVFLELESQVSKLNNHVKNAEWNEVVDDFQHLNVIVEKKGKQTFELHGIPRLYIKTLVQLEDLITPVTRAQIKSMRKFIAKAFTKMKQTLRKHNANYADEIAKYRANPDVDKKTTKESSPDEKAGTAAVDKEETVSSSKKDSDSDSDSESESDDESEFDSDGDDDSDSESDWDEEDESSSSSDDEGGQKKYTRDFWLKKNVQAGGETERERSQRERQERQKERAERYKREQAAALEAGKTATGKKEDSPLSFLSKISSLKQLKEQLATLQESRGRKGTDKLQNIAMLHAMRSIAAKYGVEHEVELLMHLLSAYLDITRQASNKSMPAKLWHECANVLFSAMRLVNRHPELEIVSTGVTGTLPDLEKSEVADGKIRVHVLGSFGSTVQTLETDLTKSLQNIDKHSTMYVERLCDEGILLRLADEVQSFYMRSGDKQWASRMALVRVEHMYYKHNTIAVKVHNAQETRIELGRRNSLHPACSRTSTRTSTPLNVALCHPASACGMAETTVTVPTLDPEAQLSSLCKFIYANGNDESKMRALLCQVYNMSLHDDYYGARDLLLMSRLQETIKQCNVSTQILFNRALVQIGLCAFRKGMMDESLEALTDICRHPKTKELLAQGTSFSRYNNIEKTREEELLENARLLPYHLHIHPDLIDAAHYIAGMLVEVPNMALNSGRVINMQFRKQFDRHTRQVFNGPAEHVKSHIMVASQNLMEGNWRGCLEHLVNLDIWSLWNHCGVEKIKTMIAEKVKLCALKAYIASSHSHYQTMSIEQLTSMFELESSEVRRVINKFIVDKKLPGTWDMEGESILLYQTEPTYLQSLCTTLAEKTALFVEANERALDVRTGDYGFRDQRDYKNSTYYQRRGGSDSRNNNASNKKSFNRYIHRDFTGLIGCTE
eukprot:g1084.t1